MMISFISLMLMVSAPSGLARPTVPELIEAAVADVSTIAVAKAAAVGFAGGVAVNSASLGAETAFKVAVDTGSSALEVAAEAGDAAVEYVSNLDAIEVLNNTEDALLEKNSAIINEVFEAKRTAVETLREVTSNHAAALTAFLNATVEGLNTVIESTQEGIKLSKNTVTDIAAELTVENAQAGLDNAQEAVYEAYNTTLHVVEQSGASLVNALVLAKQSLLEAAEEFNSKETVYKAKTNIGDAVGSGVEEAGKYVESAGIFSAIDNFVHNLAGIPNKINQFLTQEDSNIAITIQTSEDPDLARLGNPAEMPKISPESEKTPLNVANEKPETEVFEDIIARSQPSDTIEALPQEDNDNIILIDTKIRPTDYIEVSWSEKDQEALDQAVKELGEKIKDMDFK